MPYNKFQKKNFIIHVPLTQELLEQFSGEKLRSFCKLHKLRGDRDKRVSIQAILDSGKFVFTSTAHRLEEPEEKHHYKIDSKRRL